MPTYPRVSRGYVSDGASQHEVEADEAMSQLKEIIGPEASTPAKITNLSEDGFTLERIEDGRRASYDIFPSTDDPVDQEEFSTVMLPYVCARILEDPELAGSPEVTQTATQLSS
jgi:hypothetical protein